MIYMDHDIVVQANGLSPADIEVFKQRWRTACERENGLAIIEVDEPLDKMVLARLAKALYEWHANEVAMNRAPQGLVFTEYIVMFKDVDSHEARAFVDVLHKAVHIYSV